MIKNLVAMLITPPMIFWCIERAARATKFTLIDDSVVMLLKGLYENDTQSVKNGIDGIILALTKDDNVE